MPLSYCANLVRQHDPNRFLLTLLMPTQKRESLWALFALNWDIARTRAMVTDTHLGLIRLQWWRDEIHKIYNGGTGGEVPALSTLAPVIHQQNIPQDWFDNLIYAREFDLEDVAPSTMEGLWNYLDFTTTPLTRISLKILGETAEEDEIRAISQNYALFEYIRGVPLMLSRGCCLIPQDLLADHGLTSQKIIDFNHQKQVVKILKIIEMRVSPYRKPSTLLLKKMQRMTAIYMNHLKRNHFDVFSPMGQAQPAFLALRLALPEVH